MIRIHILQPTTIATTYNLNYCYWEGKDEGSLTSREMKGLFFLSLDRPWAGIFGSKHLRYTHWAATLLFLGLARTGGFF